MNNKFLKLAAHIVLIFSILGIILPITYYSVRTEDIEVLQTEHFDTDNFGRMYIYHLRDEAKNLIYNKDYYFVRKDNNITIRYSAEDEDTYLGENYFLIKYKDIAYTNVNYTENTDSLNEIKDFIKNSSDNNIEITNGNILTNKENLKRSFAELYQSFNMTYYSKDEVVNETANSTDNSNEKTTIIEEVRDTEGGIVGVAEVTSDGVREISEYNPSDLYEYNVHNVVINDFEIYANLREELPADFYGESTTIMLSNFLSKYEEAYTYILPISVVLAFVVIIYFLLYGGKTNDKNEIILNDLDKVNLELFITIICGICFVIICMIYNLITEEVFFTIKGLLLLFFLYVVSYILVAAFISTIIKRLKTKSLVSTSIILKLCRWCWGKVKLVLKLILKAIIKFRECIREILGNRRLFFRLCVYLFIIGIIMIYLVGLFEIIGIVLDCWILVFILYYVYKYLKSVEKIEKHLKDMHEGKDVDDIDLLDVDKNLKNIAIYINNISDGLDNLVEEQMKSERLKTELITNVSHDIKTPLTSIINYIDLLKKEDLKNEKAKEYLDVLDFKSQRLKKLIEDLVDASKASSGTVKLNLEKVNLNELMKQCIGEFEDKFLSKGLKVEFKENKTNIKVLADSKCLYRVIENTFTNIEKYALENTRVYVDLKEETGNVLLNIKNISKEELNISSDELMQRFVRGDKSRTTEGSGLGLSISKSLVELQKGKFEITIDGDLFKVSISFKTI